VRLAQEPCLEPVNPVHSEEEGHMKEEESKVPANRLGDIVVQEKVHPAKKTAEGGLVDISLSCERMGESCLQASERVKHPGKVGVNDGEEELPHGAEGPDGQVIDEKVKDEKDNIENVHDDADELQSIWVRAREVEDEPVH